MASEAFANPFPLADPFNGSAQEPPQAPDPAQQQVQDAQQPPAPQPKPGPLATVHGMVKNAGTGEPLPRALVRIEGDAAAGALTDGDGRFEIHGVPTGPQAFQVIKPGFRDEIATPGASGRILSMPTNASEHNVLVAAEMPDLVFTMAPSNSIRGQVELSTGDPAQRIGVMLLKRAVQQGRAVWQAATATRTNSEGVYRFAGLTDGVYAIYTDPAMDNEPATNLVEAGSDRDVARSGYATLFYPEAHDLAGAAKIELSGGKQAQANLSLSLEPFRIVRATAVLPGAGQTTAERAGMSFTAQVTDALGHQLPYTAQYDQATHTMQAMLPDGTYSLVLTAVSTEMKILSANGRYTGSGDAMARPLLGQLNFSVAGHAVTNLHVPLLPQHGNPIQVQVMHNAEQQSTSKPGGGERIFVTVSQTGGWITDGMVSTFAEGPTGDSLQTSFMAPGSYWVHSNLAERGLCESSFTAGGVSLAREPLVLGLSGAAAPLFLALRDDCATLKLSLPGVASIAVWGQEAYYTVYVVPDFDSTADVTPLTLRPTTGGTLTLENLTPGSYHVYTFAAPVELEYRNPEVLAGLQGQTVTLSPGGTSNLIVEVPGQ